MYVLVDCNNFFVSCERLFRPDLWHRPVVVLSSNDGCVIARSQEVKALGVRMGAPFFQCRDALERSGTAVFSCNFELYADLSDRVMRTVESFGLPTQVYSIDEAFVDCEPTDDVRAFAVRLRKKVMRDVGIPVSVGVAQTKTLAKVANEFVKKKHRDVGVCMLPDAAACDAVLKTLSPGEIWGVGKKTEDALARMGIHSALALKNTDIERVRERFGIGLYKTVTELRGDACVVFEHEPTAKGNITRSRSFGSPVEDAETLHAAVASFVHDAAEVLREQGSLAREIVVYARTSHFVQDGFHEDAAAMVMPRPTAATNELLAAAYVAVRRIFKSGYQFKKAGVTLGGIVSAAEAQLDLFEETYAGSRSERLMKALDGVNTRFGRGTMNFASENTDADWLPNRTFRSQKYTTDWDSLPSVRV
jgi:DNA polymerase V